MRHSLRQRFILGLVAAGVLVLPALTPTAGADVARFECTTTAGTGQTPADLSGTVGTPLSAGGCLLVTLVRDSTITESAPAAGCRLAAATQPSGGFNETANVGQTLPAGSRIWALCDQGVTDAVSAVALDDHAPTQVAPGWSVPSTVHVGNLSEPIVTGDDHGTLYYSPHSRIFRSTDSGATWRDVSPPVSEALPTLFSDTTVSVAPDGTVWWARNWGSLDSTLACVSHTRGDNWTCNNNAVPGITDRMWFTAISDSEAILETSHGAQQPEWTRTTDGGVTYVPYATTSEHGSYGNIVRDAATGAAWQAHVENSAGAPLHITRVDPPQGPVLTSLTTPMVRSDGLPIIGYADGYLWASGEPLRADGSRGLTISRSADGGKTWETFGPPQPAASVTFSSVAAGPNGQVVVAYYGSDVPLGPKANGGHWGLYVMRTTNGLAANPDWQITQVVPGVHVGSVCWYFGCEDTAQDPHARVLGDFMQPWLDRSGTIHLAYARDTNDDGVAWAQYLRSAVVSTPAPTCSAVPKPKPHGSKDKCG